MENKAFLCRNTMLSKLKIYVAFSLVVWNLISLIILLTPYKNDSWIFSLIFSSIFAAPIYVGVVISFLGTGRVNSIQQVLTDGKQLAINSISWLLIVISFISGLSIFGYQVYYYLKNGTWFSISLIDSFAYIGSDWALQPNNWYGIWNLLNKIPLSMMLAFIAIQWAYNILNSIENKSTKA